MGFQSDSIYWVEVERIVPNPFQPRREFDEARLQELAESIRMYGVLQPLTVTRKEVQREDGTFFSEYELIAGERRLRASKLAGVQQVPVIIRDGEETEQEKLELAIIENLQREDLNAVDRALAFRQLADVFGLSHTQVAKKVGRSREYVSNSIRLLALPEYVLSALRQGDISEGHARTLLMLGDRPEEQDVLFREILLKKLSVREVERIARKVATDKVRKKDPSYDPDLIEMEKRFTETLGTRVQIQKTDFGGKLTIDYFSVDDLESILGRMKEEAREKAAAAAVTSNESETLTEHTPLSVTSAEAPANEPPETEVSTTLSEEVNETEPESEVDDVPEPWQAEFQTEEVATETAVASAQPEAREESRPIESESPTSPSTSVEGEERQAPTPPVSPLAAALQRALGQVSTVESSASNKSEYAEPAVEKEESPQDVAPAAAVGESPESDNQAVNSQTKLAGTEEDDNNNLYSIRNFTI
jgi:ParB family chromosome partitioning protein